MPSNIQHESYCRNTIHQAASVKIDNVYILFKQSTIKANPVGDCLRLGHYFVRVPIVWLWPGKAEGAGRRSGRTIVEWLRAETGGTSFSSRLLWQNDIRRHAVDRA